MRVYAAHRSPSSFRTLRAIALGACLLQAPAHALSPVQSWITTGDQTQLLNQQAPVLFNQPGPGTPLTITVDPSTTYQVMEGFGAAMTDSSALLIRNELTPTARDALMEDLFSPETGIGLSYMRIPMGASDFSTSHYTYHDLPAGQADPTLASFSIAMDEADKIPALQQAAALNPNLQLMASPWSAPAWMKNNQSLYGGSLQTQYHDAYANYFKRFIQAYSAHGLPIDTLTVQNEPLNASSTYPTMTMSTFQQSTFIGDHLGPLLEANHIDTQILAYDHNWDEWNYPLIVMNDPEADQYIAGAAFHGYAGVVENQSLLQQFRPDKDIYFTEISGGDFAPNFEDNLMWNFDNLIIGSTRNWSKTVLYWNLALDQNDGPRLGGCTNCRGVVTIDTNTGEITREVEYYALAHASKFVQPGAVRIESSTFDGTLETVAFLNPDGSEVLIALNPTQSNQTFTLDRDGDTFTYTLPRRAVATLTWSPVAALPGDVDLSGVVDSADIDLLFATIGQANPLFDLDGDAGLIDLDDATYLIENILGTIRGDTNLDGRVNLIDLSNLATNFETFSNWAGGDFSGDTIVNLIDLSLLATNFGFDANAIPEPTSLFLLTGLGTTLLRRSDTIRTAA
ncbi:glycoside hydrolase family 30 beta sandwich domain-containing protein [Mucisphaera sp.]|uniref:glycoside hydrolase family 30 beta sandwich domain-containing protein n=1 Tax=Mucisphaera sp. TaxID=2913024 RepID=UPI003D0BCD9E